MIEIINIKKRKLSIIISLISIVILFFSGYSIGKEFQRINLTTEAEVAKPILKVDNSPTIEIEKIDETYYYNFIVKNYDETGNVTQIDLEYDIEIISDKNSIISYKLYKEEKEINFENNKTEKFLLSKNNKQEHHYKIQILCNKTDVQEIMNDIQIKVHSEQKKV